MARIYKRKNIWYIDVRVNGKRIRKRVGTSKKVAELALRDTEVKIAKEEFGFSKKDITVDRLIEQFLEYSRTNNRQSTAKRYKAITDHLRKYISESKPNVISVSQLSPEVIEGYKSFRRDAWVNPNGKSVISVDNITESTRKGARARTVNIELDGIRAMLNLAIKWGYLKENPIKMVKRLKEDDKKPVRYLTKKECKEFLSAAPPNLYPIYYTFLYTGMRKAELENLTWRDVDFKNRKILIRSKENWRPKTGERSIPMNDGVFKILSNLRKNRNKALNNDFVFEAKDSGHSHNWLREELIKIADKAGIRDLTKIHTLRHTFASHLVMSGVDLPSVQKLMGHTNIDTTMIYAHLAPDHLSHAINKLKLD